MSTSTYDFQNAHTYLGIPLEENLVHNTTILSYLEYHAKKQPDATYLTWVSKEGNSYSISFNECLEKVLQWSTWFDKEIGFTKRETVALFPTNDLHAVIAILGLLNSGCRILFLNPNNPIKRSCEQIQKVDAKIVLRSPNLSQDVYSESKALPDFRSLETLEKSALIQEKDPLEESFFFGTSGSTAASKMVAQTQYSAVINATALQKHHQLGKTSLVMSCLPIYHVNGFHFTILANLISGSHAVLLFDFNPFNFPLQIEHYKPTIVSVVPSILEALLEVRRNQEMPEELKYFVTAAAPLSAQTAREVYKTWNKKIVQGYGLTETTNFSTKLPISISDEHYKRYMLDTEIPSIGAAVYGNEVEILDSEGKVVEDGILGEICMRGHNVMEGYYANIEATDIAFKNGWFHSGDLGYKTTCATTGFSFFYIKGRLKNIAKVRGESVSLEEMERVLISIPQVKDAACAIKGRKFFDEEIVVGIVYYDDNELDETTIKTYLKDVFPVVVIPDIYIKLDSIPRTPTGKLKRLELLESLVKIL